jgi:antitoxin component HigA of HigAB toxin-antitoxin module
MDIHPIRNDRDHAKAMRQIDKLWVAAAGTPEADVLDVLVTLVEAYEAKQHTIEPPDPIEAIKFRMEQQGPTAPWAHCSPLAGVASWLMVPSGSVSRLRFPADTLSA